MTTAATVLLKVDATPGLGRHEAGGEAEKALNRSVVHDGQSTKRKGTRKSKAELSAKALAMDEAYPDYADRVDGKLGRLGRAVRIRSAALARCARCGLLLPCLDCLPEHAPEFQEHRMVRPEIGGLPEKVDFMHVKTSAWLAAKDAEAGRMKGGKYRPRPLLYGVKAP